MRTLTWVFVAFLCGAATASAQEAPASESRALRSPEMRIELSLLKNWEAEKVGDVGMRLSPGIDKWEEDLPPPNHPWVWILRPETGDCLSDSRVVPPFTYQAKKSEVAVCKAGWAVVLGYWESDKEHNKHVAEMLEILASIKPLK